MNLYLCDTSATVNKLYEAAVVKSIEKYIIQKIAVTWIPLLF